MATIEQRLRKDGKICYAVKVRLRGSPTQTATFQNRTRAKEWAASVESAIREGRHFPRAESKKHTFLELLTRFEESIRITRPSILNERFCQHEFWKERLGPVLLSDIKLDAIQKARNELLSGQTVRKVSRSPATVNRYLAALSRIFSFALRDLGWIESNPLARVKKERESRGRTRFLSDKERGELLSKCKTSKRKELYPIVVLALATGMRKGEILGLTRSQVDLEKGTIQLEKTKNGERRSIPLLTFALDCLKAFLKVRHINTDLLFPSRSDPTKPVDIRAAWEKALKDSKVADFRFHDLRHSCASYLAMNGATPTDIADILGHKTLAMVKRYAHLSDEHKRKVVAGMNERIFS